TGARRPSPWRRPFNPPGSALRRNTACVIHGGHHIISENSLTRAIFNVRATGVKDRVERAAVELFAARGVDGVSIADIAGTAGVSQGALYRHYRGKDELATQLFADAYLRTGTDLAAIRAAQPR